MSPAVDRVDFWLKYCSIQVKYLDPSVNFFELQSTSKKTVELGCARTFWAFLAAMQTVFQDRAGQKGGRGGGEGGQDAAVAPGCRDAEVAAGCTRCTAQGS